MFLMRGKLRFIILHQFSSSELPQYIKRVPNSGFAWHLDADWKWSKLRYALGTVTAQNFVTVTNFCYRDFSDDKQWYVVPVFILFRGTHETLHVTYPKVRGFFY
jgi:hypothetical protein